MKYTVTLEMTEDKCIKAFGSVPHGHQIDELGDPQSLIEALTPHQMSKLIAQLREHQSQVNQYFNSELNKYVIEQLNNL